MRRRGAAGRGRGGAAARGKPARGGAKAPAADSKTLRDEDNEINEEGEVDGGAENNPNSIQFSYGTGILAT